MSSKKTPTKEPTKRKKEFSRAQKNRLEGLLIQRQIFKDAGKGDKAREFCAAAGIIPSQFSRWISKKNKDQQGISEDRAREIEAALDLPDKYLEQPHAPSSSWVIHQMQIPDDINIDLSDAITSWTIPKEWLKNYLPSKTDAADLALLTCYDNSMSDVAGAGDPALIDTSVNAINSDGAYVFTIEDDLYIRRLQKIPGSGIQVLSDNSSYQPWMITSDIKIAVLGKVLKFWKGDSV
jgi:hypothetical protein